MKNGFVDVKGFENLYAINKNGDVYSYLSGMMMKPIVNNRGYLRITLFKRPKHITVKVHRMVANAFIPNPDNKPQVNHINGNKKDNRVENLEWCTNEENRKHAIDNNLINSKILSDGAKLSCFKNRKLTYQDAENIRQLHKNNTKTATELSKIYNVTITCICNILKRKTYKIKSY